MAEFFDSGAQIIELRDYQDSVIDNLRAGMRDGHRRQIISLPTGAGKTVLASHLLKETMDNGRRGMFVCDRLALVDQTSRMLRQYGLHHAVVQGKRLWSVMDDRIFVCSAQTLERRRWPDVELIIVDEAHTVRKNTTEHIMGLEHGYAVGLTATPFTRGLADIWSRVVTATTTNELIKQGWLVPLKVYAAREIDMEGAKTSNNGEWQASEVETRGTAIVGDIVTEWVAKTLDHFGGPAKTLVFSATVAHGEHICDAFQNAGYDFRQISYKDRDDFRRAELIREFRASDGKSGLIGLVSVEALCLSEDTEILTRRGWMGIDDIHDDDLVANFFPDDGSISFSAPLKIVRRATEPGEQWVEYEGKPAFRVTGNHRMLVRAGGKRDRWREVTAASIVGKHVGIPVSGNGQPLPVQLPMPEHPASSSERRVAANAWVLRKQGMDADEARSTALERITARDAMSYRTPPDLTLDECAFIGFWIGDGSRYEAAAGGVSYTLAQSLRYRPIVSWVDSLVRRLGFHVTVRELPQMGNMTAPAVEWRFPRGTGFGPQRKAGLFHLEPWLNKDGADLLWGLNADQFESLIHGLWLADGDHSAPYQNDNWQRRITSASKNLLDLLQAIAVCRGWKASLRESKPATAKHRARYTLGLRKAEDVRLGSGKSIVAMPAAGERAWCVTTDSGYIVTRRKGYVAIMGNSKGFDVPDVQVLIGARPYRKSLSGHIQQIGRGMRPHPGKDFCLMLDHAGNMHGFYDETVDFFENGVDSLRAKMQKKSVTRREGKERADVKCKSCNFVFTGQTCPSCGAQRPRKPAGVRALPGRLDELDLSGGTVMDLSRSDKQKVWRSLCEVTANITLSAEKGKKMALAQYRELFGEWPPYSWGYSPAGEEPLPGTQRLVKRQLTAYRQRSARK